MGSGDTLYSVDLVTGNSSKAKSSMSGISLIEYEKSCPSDLTGIEKLTARSLTYRIFPNPFSSVTTIETEETLDNAGLTIYNCFGQAIDRLQNISGRTIKINRSNLPAGLYFVTLSHRDNILLIDKLVVSD